MADPISNRPNDTAAHAAGQRSVQTGSAVQGQGTVQHDTNLVVSTATGQPFVGMQPTKPVLDAPKGPRTAQMYTEAQRVIRSMMDSPAQDALGQSTMRALLAINDAAISGLKDDYSNLESVRRRLESAYALQVTQMEVAARSSLSESLNQAAVQLVNAAAEVAVMIVTIAVGSLGSVVKEAGKEVAKEVATDVATDAAKAEAKSALYKEQAAKIWENLKPTLRSLAKNGTQYTVKSKLQEVLGPAIETQLKGAVDSLYEKALGSQLPEVALKKEGGLRDQLKTDMQGIKESTLEMMKASRDKESLKENISVVKEKTSDLASHAKEGLGKDAMKERIGEMKSSLKDGSYAAALRDDAVDWATQKLFNGIAESLVHPMDPSKGLEMRAEMDAKIVEFGRTVLQSVDAALAAAMDQVSANQEFIESIQDTIGALQESDNQGKQSIASII